MPLPHYPITGDIITQARKEAGIGSNPIASALQQEALLQRLVDLDGEGVAYPNSVGFLGFWFNDREFIIETIAKTSLQSGISSGATSLTLASGTGWDSPSSDLGAGFIKNNNEAFDFFTFEGRSSGVLSNVSGVQMDHAASEEVHKLYKLPSRFGWPRAMFRQSRFLTFRNKTASFRQVPAGGTYSVQYMESASYNALFAIFPVDSDSLDWVLKYQMAAIAEANMETILTLPGVSNGRRYYIEGLKEYIYHNEGESEDEQKAASKKLYHLERLLDEYGIEDQSGDQGFTMQDW